MLYALLTQTEVEFLVQQDSWFLKDVNFQAYNKTDTLLFRTNSKNKFNFTALNESLHALYIQQLQGDRLQMKQICAMGILYKRYTSKTKATSLHNLESTKVNRKYLISNQHSSAHLTFQEARTIFSTCSLVSVFSSCECTCESYQLEGRD